MSSTPTTWTYTATMFEGEGAAWALTITSDRGHQVPVTAWRTIEHAARFVRRVTGVERVRWNQLDQPGRKIGQRTV